MIKVQQKQQIEFYIGLSTTAAETIYKLYKGEMMIRDVKKQTMDNFIRHELISADRASVTFPGETAARTYEQIISNKYEPLKPQLSEKAFQQLSKIQQIARLPIVSGLGLRSSHMKALRMVARMPGVAKMHMEKVFDKVSIIDELSTKELVHTSVLQHDLYLTIQGLRLLRMCAGFE